MIGAPAPIPEIELLHAVSDVFKTLNFDKLAIHINDRRILRAMIAVAGIDEALETTAITAIDKLDKIGNDGVLKELAQRGIAHESAQKLLSLLEVKEDNAATLANMESIFANHEDAMNAIRELRIIVEASSAFDDGVKVRVSPELARGLNYYTGAIFEVKALDFQIGSICGGGRYDNLTGIFGLPNISGVGISFGADRIYDVLKGLDKFPKDAIEGTKLLFSNMGSTETAYALPIAARLRSQGISCEIYPDNTKLKKQFDYASKKGIRYFAIIGEDEIKAGEVTLKDLTTGTQQRVPKEELKSLL